MHDQKIIELIQSNREDKALNVLYRHFSMVRKNIMAKGGNAQDAEDVFQEALIILCRKVKQPDFSLTSQLSTFLFGISRFLWKAELRKRKPLLTVEVDTGLAAPDEKALEELIKEENEARQAERVLTEMAERCRDLLVLFYKMGLSLKAIALKMGYSSENTARNQKYKCLEGARNKLRELKQTTQTL